MNFVKRWRALWVGALLFSGGVYVDVDARGPVFAASPAVWQDLVAPPAAATPTPHPGKPPSDVPALVAQVQDYCQLVQRDWQVPGLSIAIVYRGETVLMQGWGVRELGSEGTVDADTVFAIASNSKAFTTVILAMLVAEGRIEWDAPVTRYLPEFQMSAPFITAELTVRDLVCHRSGLDTFSGDLLWYDTTYTPAEILARVSKLSPVSSFRSQFGYQNLMYIAAGQLIERVTGQTWGVVVQQRILQPLGMNRTTTSVTELAENFASPHNESGGPTAEGRIAGNALRSLPVGNVDNCTGACGLNSSAADLSQWLKFLLARGEWQGVPLIPREQIWELWQPLIFNPITEPAYQANPGRHFQAYGMGFGIHDHFGHKIVGHSGGLDGMISQLALVPEQQLGVVILTNSETPVSRLIRDRVLDLFLGTPESGDRNQAALNARAAQLQMRQEAWERREAERKSPAPPSLPLADYAGTYRCPLYGDVVVEFQGGALVMKFAPAPNLVADLEHWHFNTFQIKWRDSVHYNFRHGFVNFTLAADGLTEQLQIDQPNDDFWFYELKLIRVRE